MEPKKIKSKLILTGTTQADIAKSLCVSRQAVNLVINGKERSRRIEQAVSQRLRMRVDQVFPKGDRRK